MYGRCCFLLSAGVINLLYFVAFALRHIVTKLINTVLFVRLRHAASGVPILHPLTPDDISLQRRGEHFGLRVRRLCFDAKCPMAYRMFEMSNGRVLIVEFLYLQNAWIGLHSSNATLAIETVAAQYHIVSTHDNWGALQFLKPVLGSGICPSRSSPNLSSDSALLRQNNDSPTEIEYKDAFMSRQENLSSAKNIAETQHAEATLQATIVVALQKLSIDIERLVVCQKPKTSAATATSTAANLNLTVIGVKYHFYEQNYVFQMSDFLVQLTDKEHSLAQLTEKNFLAQTTETGHARADAATDIVTMRFTKPLFAKLSQNAQRLRVAFDDKCATVSTNLKSTAIAEITKWCQNNLSRHLRRREQSLETQEETSRAEHEQQQQQQQQPWQHRRHSNDRYCQKGSNFEPQSKKSKRPFRFELCLSVRLIVRTKDHNVVRCRLSDLNVCYDNIIDSNRVVAQLAYAAIQVCRQNNSVAATTAAAAAAASATAAVSERLQVRIGVVESDILLLRNGIGSVSVFLCESAKLQHTANAKHSDSCQHNGTTLVLAAEAQLFWNAAEPEHLSVHVKEVDDAPHLFAASDAGSLNLCLSMLNDTLRDLLDTLLPNRLFVPGLAEARCELHTRTDRPLAAVEQKRRISASSIYRQPPVAFVISLAGTAGCNVEIKLFERQSTSYCTLVLCIAMFEFSTFALPTTLSEFCESTLASSWALNLTRIVLRDSVVGSHWRHACDVKPPVYVRFIQKCRYLPFLKSEKKLRIYTTMAQENDATVKLHAHIHECLLRFLVRYYQSATQTTPNDEYDNDSAPGTAQTNATADTDARKQPRADSDGGSGGAWWLRIARLDFTISYKPQTKNGSLMHATFLNLPNVPNLSLSNARISFRAYDTADYAPPPPTSLNACMQQYFSQCCPQVESILLSASKALPVIQPVVQTTSDLASDLANPHRSWKQTAARVASNVIYGGSKLSVATFKLARSTDRWLAKKQHQQCRRPAPPTSTTQSCPSNVLTHSALRDSPTLSSPLASLENYAVPDGNFKSLIKDAQCVNKARNGRDKYRRDNASRGDDARQDDDKDDAADGEEEEETDNNDKEAEDDDEEEAEDEDEEKAEDDDEKEDDEDARKKLGDADVFFEMETAAPPPPPPPPPIANDDDDDENVSIYANQPHSVTRGLSDGGAVLQQNVQIAFDALIVEPQRAYKENGRSWRHGAAAALYGLPRLLLRSATGISGATAKLGHGISNAIDKEKCEQRKKKWKNASYVN